MRKKIVDGVGALASVEATRERVKRWQERQKILGRVRVVVWVPVGRVGEVQRLAQELRNKEDDLDRKTVGPVSSGEATSGA